MKPLPLHLLPVIFFVYPAFSHITVNAYPDFGIASKNVDEVFLLPENPKVRVLFPGLRIDGRSTATAGFIMSPHSSISSDDVGKSIYAWSEFDVKRGKLGIWMSDVLIHSDGPFHDYNTSAACWMQPRDWGALKGISFYLSRYDHYGEKRAFSISEHAIVRNDLCTTKVNSSVVYGISNAYNLNVQLLFNHSFFDRERHFLDGSAADSTVADSRRYDGTMIIGVIDTNNRRLNCGVTIHRKNGYGTFSGSDVYRDRNYFRIFLNAALTDRIRFLGGNFNCGVNGFAGFHHQSLPRPGTYSVSGGSDSIEVTSTSFLWSTVHAPLLWELKVFDLPIFVRFNLAVDLSIEYSPEVIRINQASSRIGSGLRYDAARKLAGLLYYSMEQKDNQLTEPLSAVFGAELQYRFR